MTSTRFYLLLTLSLLVQCFIQAQEWTSYQSPNKVNDLVDTGTELLLATDAGLVVVNKATLERETFDINNTELTNNHIQTITKGLNGSIWIGTYDIVLFQFTGTGFSNRTKPSNDALRPFTQMYDLKIAPNGDFWIASDDGVFHGEGETWSNYGTAEFGPRFFESWDIDITDNGDVYVAGREIHKRVGEDWVNLSEGSEFEGYLDADLFTSSTGDLFVAGDLSNVFRFDGQDWQSYGIDFNGSELVGFAEDTNGNIYFNTLQDGIFKLEFDTFVQQLDNVQAIEFDNMTNYFHIDAQNRSWLNSNISLSVVENGNTRSTLLADHRLVSNFVPRPIRGENGKMYFSNYQQNEFSVVDAEGNWSTLSNPTSDVTGESLFASDLVVAADNDILAITELGLHQFDGTDWILVKSLENCNRILKDSQGRIYIWSVGKIYLVDNGVLNEYNTTNSPLTSIRTGGYGIDANDNIWIASSEFETENVIQTVTRNGEWTTYSAADHPVIKRPTGKFTFDNDGNAWIINEPFGALKFDGSTWTDPIRETEIDVITNRGVHSMTIDAAGKLYFGHGYGISTFQDGEWENFINEDVTTNNSQSTSIEFNDAGILWWANGRVGLFSFEPEFVSSTTSSFGSDIAAGFKLFPNPAQIYTTLDFTTKVSARVNVAVYNQLGQLAANIDLGRLSEGTYQREINIDRLTPGFYTVQLQINNSSSTSKLIVR